VSQDKNDDEIFEMLNQNSQETNKNQFSDDDEIDFNSFFGDLGNDPLEENLSDDLPTNINSEPSVAETPTDNSDSDDVVLISDDFGLPDEGISSDNSHLNKELDNEEEGLIHIDDIDYINNDDVIDDIIMVDPKLTEKTEHSDEQASPEKTDELPLEKPVKPKFFGHRLLSWIVGVKPVGTEGLICVIVFSIFLLWLIYMNLQVLFGQPNVSSNSVMLYAVLLNFFGACGLLIPAWLFFNRGTMSEDNRDMKDRNNIFRVMLGGGLIVLVVGVIVLMTECLRYDFTVKAGDVQKISTVDGQTKIPEIKPNSINLDPIPE
jgi:hypothetical protein